MPLQCFFTFAHIPQDVPSTEGRLSSSCCGSCQVCTGYARPPKTLLQLSSLDNYKAEDSLFRFTYQLCYMSNDLKISVKQTNKHMFQCTACGTHHNACSQWLERAKGDKQVQLGLQMQRSFSDIYSRGQRLAVINMLNIPSGQRLAVINGFEMITSPWRGCGSAHVFVFLS